MKLAQIKIKMDNAAFKDNPYELSQILRDLADKIEQKGITEKKLYDYNGNHVGNFKITGR